MRSGPSHSLQWRNTICCLSFAPTFPSSTRQHASLPFHSVPEYLHSWSTNKGSMLICMLLLVPPYDDGALSSRLQSCFSFLQKQELRRLGPLGANLFSAQSRE